MRARGGEGRQPYSVAIDGVRPLLVAVQRHRGSR